MKSGSLIGANNDLFITHKELQSNKLRRGNQLTILGLAI